MNTQNPYTTSDAQAPKPNEDDRPKVVLVHGALTDASVWHGVITVLQQHGYETLAPAIPMRGFASDVTLTQQPTSTDAVALT